MSLSTLYRCALSVILEQRDEERKLRPVSFESHKLNKHEVNYVFGCNANERYIAGTTFDVWADHQALSWLFNKAMLKGHLMRWVLALQSFDFRVRYKLR